MLVVPSLDLRNGRSRLVWWPGAATGSGTPTDRPERIAQAFVAQGAPMLHLVDLDGAARGRPANLEAIGAVARTVAVPLQLAGGVDGPEQVELAFAAGATRVVVPLWAADDPERLRAMLSIAGDWLAVGLDARPDRLAEFQWKGRTTVPTLHQLMAELAGAGVHRFVLSHGGASPDPGVLRSLAESVDAELVVAGGIRSGESLSEMRDAGVRAVILGEAIFTGAVDYPAAVAAAA
jgi:phosphoribosylformimino-5-aminoimidazole carboxamide ribotide isomerase